MQGNDYKALQGKTVYGNDGEKIGKIADLYDDDSGGTPVFATVTTGLFGSHSSFVPMAQATPQGDDVQVPYTKDFVKNAPRVTADEEISVQEEQEIFSYYGLGGGSTGATGGGYETTATTGTTGTYETAGTTGTRGASETGTVRGAGHDTSGPDTDDAMTRSEERVTVGVAQTEVGRARLRKYIVTENVTQTVPVSREQVVVEREPITEANRGAALSGGELTEEEHEVTLHAEQAVVQKETVPVERVRLGTETVTEQQQVDASVRKEQIEVEEGTTTTGTTTDGRTV